MEFATVTLNGETTYRALIADNRWNGFAVAFLDHDQMQTFAKVINDHQSEWDASFEDRFVYNEASGDWSHESWEWNGTRYDLESVEEIEPEIFEGTAYWMAGDGYTWQIVEDSE